MAVQATPNDSASSTGSESVPVFQPRRSHAGGTHNSAIQAGPRNVIAQEALHGTVSYVAEALVYIRRALQDDVILLHRVACGDQQAVGELYDLHSQLVFGLLLRILTQRAEAEEVLQEVFLQAWRQAHTYDALRGTPAGWLCGIARNRAIDRVRARARTGRILGGVEAPPQPDTPEALASISERNRDVHRALNALPSEQRELIERAYFTGATQSEMALELGLPLGTVKTRVRAGLQTLRRMLDPVPVDK